MDFSKLEELIDTMEQRGIPLCDVSVTHRGEEVFRHTSGYSDAECKKPVSHDDLYWIFSASKVVTCVAAIRLLEEGKISLDDPVSKYIPSFAHLNVVDRAGNISPAKNEMKLIHLFTMTGGMTYNTDDPAVKEAISKEDATTYSIVSSFAQMPLVFEPGTHYKYSLCHDVLAAVVEVASGMRFSDYLHKIIFDPLEMANIGFVPNDEQKKRFTAMYKYDNGSAKSTLIPTENRSINHKNYESGGGGIFSDVDSYMKMLTALSLGGMSKSGYRLLKPESVALMEVNRLNSDSLRDFVVGGRLYGYGWGLCGRVHINPVCSFSRSSVGEFGWDGAAAAFAMVDRKRETALYFATEVMGSHYCYTTIHPLVRNLVCEQITLD